MGATGRDLLLGRPRVWGDFPLLVYWESTQACDLACVHCRAAAIREPAPGELSTDMALGLVDEVASFRRAVLVVTGGDPLKRPDLPEVLAHARGRGLRVAVTPAAGPPLDAAAMAGLADAGVSAVSLSLDGSSAALHDSFRGVPGAFERTVAGAQAAQEAGLPLQVNTTVAADTADDLPAIAERVEALGAHRWAVFFLIPVGRGRSLREVVPAASECLCRWLIDLAADAPFEVKTTEAHHIRRIAVQRMRARGVPDAEIEATSLGRGFGIRDGNGVVFVSSRGDVFPSGFLPLAVANVNDVPLAEAYREAPLLRALRDPSRFSGRCGRCPYRSLCGGSRARAFTAHGDPFAEDPLCPFVPPEVAAPWTS